MMEKLTLRKTLQEMNKNLLQRGLKPSLNLSKNELNKEQNLQILEAFPQQHKKFSTQKRDSKTLFFLHGFLHFGQIQFTLLQLLFI